MREFNFVEIFNACFFSIEATKDNYRNSLPYYRIKTTDSVICCILNANDELLLVKQMRPNLGYETLEFPAGGIDENENPITAAKREIREELGFNARLIHLGAYRLMMNRTVNQEHLFIGLVLDSDIMGCPESGISIEKIPRKNFIDFIRQKKIEQLAALGIINLINIKFQLDFLSDARVIDQIWSKSLSR